MDETEYKALYDAVNTERCVFEKAMLTRRFGCDKVVRINIAEREAVGCSSVAALGVCEQLLKQLRQSAAFALKTAGGGGRLPHAKEIKVQCGGLLGLAAVLQASDPTAPTANNVYGLINAAIAEFQSLERIPYGEIVRSIAHFQGRKKRSR